MNDPKIDIRASFSMANGSARELRRSAAIGDAYATIVIDAAAYPGYVTDDQLDAAIIRALDAELSAGVLS